MSHDGMNLVAPRAEERPVTRVVHGVTVTDPFAWLRADNWQEVMRDPTRLDPAIRAHLEAENAYLEAFMAPTADLQAALVAEMRGRIKEDDASVPLPDGPYAYGVRHREGGQHPLIFRTPRAGGDETILLDGDAMATGLAYFSLRGTKHSPDHKLMAYGVDDKGSEYYTVRIRDLASGTDLADTIPETGGSVAWAEDSASFFYVWLDENHRPSKVYHHVLGTPRDADRVVYEEADAGFFVGLSVTQSGRFILIEAHDHETSEVWAIDARAPQTPPRLIAGRVVGEEVSVDHAEIDGADVFVILTNTQGAEDFKIMTAPVAAPDRAHWVDLVPHMPGRLILSHGVLKTALVRLERDEGLPRIVIRTFADGHEQVIAFAEEAYSLGMSLGYEFDTTTMRFTYSSMTTPSQVYDYDIATGERVLRKTQVVPSGHNPDDYVTRRVMATAPDGERVPVSLIHHHTTKLDGTAPLLLYGYGAYGITIPAGFSTNSLSLVNRGFVYAIAHIRGGKDKGYRWYRLGKREHKPNTFTDFIAAAEHLIKEGFVDPRRVVAQGGSAGGMLMGAVANLRPDLFAGIIAEVPFVDVLTTMLDPTLPLTPPEWPEWGNPIEDEAAFRTILSYSPVDQVAAKAYPAIIALAGLTDPRVTYWEPAKWVARLRTASTSANPILLKTNMDSGHGGASGRFDRLKEVALVQAFALKICGA